MNTGDFAIDRGGHGARDLGRAALSAAGASPGGVASGCAGSTTVGALAGEGIAVGTTWACSS
jgi:hypothetical protein